MGLIPKWVGQFPSSLWETFQESAKVGWEGFKGDISTGTKTVVKGVETTVKGILGWFTPTVIIVMVVLLFVLILWKQVTK